jgi:hypothetical protein
MDAGIKSQKIEMAIPVAICDSFHVDVVDCIYKHFHMPLVIVADLGRKGHPLWSQCD